ncbi:hypothetical protein [Micromonospora aurantiaca (nom. illeg.)]|uniref:hypothetical protein n=1 Tax=Micromonospora aurantiaca (nom. illeg.) TaxID=47850 RepID=UPI00082783C5|nr:hypothetical protein [Micromonospora aurantiaca]SCL33511.1 hypothetical protein GA0070615_2303 [Micromonospora aurantiaca]
MTRDDTSPTERILIARIAAAERWGRTVDRTAATEPARKAFRDRFEAQVPPEVTDPDRRAEMAEHLRRAFYQRLALKSAQARRNRKGKAA